MTISMSIRLSIDKENAVSEDETKYLRSLQLALKIVLEPMV